MEETKTRKNSDWNGIQIFALVLLTTSLLIRCHDEDGTKDLNVKLDLILVNQKKEKEQMSIVEGRVNTILNNIESR